MLADQTERYQEALELIERAIAISPDDPAIIDSLGWAQFKLGRYEEALTNLRRAYAVFPDAECFTRRRSPVDDGTRTGGRRNLARRTSKPT